MNFPPLNPRLAILTFSFASLAALLLVLSERPQSASSPSLAARYSDFASADQVTETIRDPRTSLISVGIDDPSDRLKAAKLGSVIADHGSFAVIAADGLPPALGAGVSRIDTSIHLPGRSFDPVKSPPAGTVAAGDLRAASFERGYYIVQFGSTPTDALLDSIRDAGMQVIQYVPHQAYIVYGDGSAADRAASHSRVRWTGRYLAEYKTSEILREQLNAERRGRAPAKGISRIERTGRTTAIFDVAVFDNADLGQAGQQIAAATNGKIRSIIDLPNNFFNVVRVEADLGRISNAANVESVFSIEAAGKPQKEDEVAAQIVAGNYVGNVVDPPGYDPLSQFGVDGSGVTVAVVDDGVGIPGDGGYYVTSNNAVNGPLRGATAGARGHGHLQASIIAGDTPFSILDPNGYNYGSGIAPKAHIINIPFLRSGYSGNEAATANDVVTTLGPNGVLGYISNNSWGNGTNGNVYDSYTAQFDGFVQDASADVNFIDPLVLVFSAGNSGTSGLTRPKVAKNVIAVAATENIRPTLNSSSGSTFPADNLEQIPDFSSRGLAADGRIKPDISAPGDAVTGGRSGTDALFGDIDTYHRVSSGTSHAAPQVAGAAALFTQFWKAGNGGFNPSPAMVKAALINGAVDVTGAGALGARPNGSEGWGRINLKNVLNTGASTTYIDQTVALNSVGEVRNFVGSVADNSRPLRVSLVWTDPPAAGDPALVNDLDLEVLVGGNKYRGNVFSGGLSVAGGSADSRNNVENVFLPAGVSGPVTIRVLAKALNGNGILGGADSTDQHFALVVHNASATLSSAASPDGAQPVVITGNGLLEPNECNLINVPVTNLGPSAATGVTATLTSNTPGVTVNVGNANYPDIAAGSTANGSTSFQISTSNAVACATNVDLVLTVSYDGMIAPAVFNYSLRVGSPPDANYTFTSSTGNTISSGGTLVTGSSVDDAVINFTTPFAFSVYDTPVPAGSTIRLGTNGHIRIESAGSADTSTVNAPLPSTGGSGSPFPTNLPVIMPYWDDLDMRPSVTVGGGIYSEVTGSPGTRTLKLEWRARNYLASQPQGPPNVQFAVYFYENSDTFDYVYELTGGSGSFASGSSATVGVQSATTGTTFTQFSHNTASLSQGLKLTAARAPGICNSGFGTCVVTAANVSISGRVVTAEGRAIRGALVTVNDDNGNMYRVLTNSFGYFTVADLRAGGAAVIGVTAKGYTFPSQLVELSDSVSGLIFTGQR